MTETTQFKLTAEQAAKLRADWGSIADAPPLQLLCHKDALRVAETGVPVFVRPHYVVGAGDPRLIGCQIGIDAAILSIDLGLDEPKKVRALEIALDFALSLQCLLPANAFGVEVIANGIGAEPGLRSDDANGSAAMAADQGHTERSPISGGVVTRTIGEAGPAVMAGPVIP